MIYLTIISLIFLILIVVIKNIKTENFESIRKQKVKFSWKDKNLNPDQIKTFFSDDLHKKYDYNTLKKDCIFVSIPSYRDKNCIKTVKSIYKNAAEPEKIFLGIYTQNKDNTENCYDDTLKRYRNNITIKNVDHKKALGPQHARYVCSHLWNGEEYFLMIDSHLIFRKNWDRLLKDTYKTSPSKKTILTGYPPSHEDKNAFNDTDFTYTCDSHFDHDNFHIISGAQGRAQTKEIWSTPYASAGFFFTNYKWLYEVPFDPYLPNLFQGEEILLATRSYTHGWDLFNPNINFATHYYDRVKDKEPHFWDDNNDYTKIQQLSNMRYYYIIDECNIEDVHPEFRKHINYYGLGKERTLEDYFKFSNIDLKNNRIDTRCNEKYNFKKKKWIKL